MRELHESDELVEENVVSQLCAAYQNQVPYLAAALPKLKQKRARRMHVLIAEARRSTREEVQMPM